MRRLIFAALTAAVLAVPALADGLTGFKLPAYAGAVFEGSFALASGS